MCLIAVSTSGFRELSAEFWQAACTANPHGIGLLTHDGNGVVTHKLLQSCPRVLAELLGTVQPGRRVAIHLREATFGSRCAANAHPHVLQDPLGQPLLAMMHNGSVPQMAAALDDGPSDSALLLTRWLAPRLDLHGALHTSGLKALDEFLPPRNRLVLLNRRGDWQIVREHEGFWLGQTWLSNPKAQDWLQAAIPG